MTGRGIPVSKSKIQENNVHSRSNHHSKLPFMCNSIQFILSIAATAQHKSSHYLWHRFTFIIVPHFSFVLSLTSYPLLCFMRVHRFIWWLSGGSDPICCSALPWPWGAATLRFLCFCWGFWGRLASGCGLSGFTIEWLLAELEATGELLMLEGDEEMKKL